MSFTPLTKDALKQNIQAIPSLSGNIAVQQEIDPITKEQDLTFDKYCTATVSTVTDNIAPNTKERLDALEADYDKIVTTLTTLASALVAMPPTSVLGGVMLTDMTAQGEDVLTRAATKTTQDVLQKPYLDGSK